MYSKALSLLLVSEKISVSEMLTFLEAKKLLSLLPEIMRELKLRKDELRNEKLLTLETPFPLSDESVDTIKELLTIKEDCEVKQKERRDLLSGFRATYKHQSYDASARKLINQLTQ